MGCACLSAMLGLKRLALSSETIFTPRKKLFSFSLLVALYLVVFALLLPNNSFSDSKFHHPSSSPSANVSGTQYGTLLRDSIDNIKNASLHVGEQSFQTKASEDNRTATTFSDSNVQKNSSDIIKDKCSSGETDRNTANIARGTMAAVSLKNSSFSSESHIVGNFSQGKLVGDSIENRNASLIHRRNSQPEETKKVGLYKDCDIFDGKWVRDDSKPLYPLGSCPHIDKSFDCHLHGRPDTDYVKWRWQPNGCDIPRLNTTDFLERLRGKRLAYVGDSLNRNMWESMVCTFRHSIRNKKRVYEISGRTDFKKRGFYSFRFEDYNCSVDFIVSPFIVRESSFRGKNGTFETLRLDLMDKKASTCHDADIIVFNTGHWWTHEKTSRGEEYYQEGNSVYPKLGVLDAYRKALTTWARWVDRNIDANRTQVFFRGYSQSHFSGGQWNSGGQCHRESEPIFNETYLQEYPGKMRVVEQVIQKMRNPVTYMNITRLTDYRKDGHPSIYRMKYQSEAEWKSAESSQDCSHWCLPGVPDTWNELLYASLLQHGKGEWKS
ncbi:protein trichome birefringence-like 2 [Prosopis cineraria]|uniref:protein trichome birefringence-like 2 n=1 Tax=Prosopis cineraria TaxID=364024 RepID=UPI00240ED64C|nr:protein trichome birefringence-like 2 [Prosopis cineraria]